MSNARYYDNSIISLDEGENPYSQRRKKKNENENINSSKYSFFSTFINSIGKLGQGLKNIMSMKINFGEDDDKFNEQNIYSQKENRFNTQEEISLIEAPSFMKDCHSFYRYNTSDKNISENNIQNKDDSKMILSNIEYSRENFDNNSFNKNDILNKEEIEMNNSSILKDSPDKAKNQTTLLNKKRERVPRNQIISTIFEEEDEKNNDEEFQEKKIKTIKENENESQKQILKKNRNNSSINNISMNKNRNNSSMNISMKSLDSIKEEISQRRKENLRHIEELYKKNDLYYDYLKEEKMREKILDEYYKDKAKRIAEGRLQMEREKRKKEEEFKKLRIRKETGLKFASIQKKPKVFKQIKSDDIHFSGKPLPQNQNSLINSNENKTNNLNVTFGENNSYDEKKNQKNEINEPNQSTLFPINNSSVPDNKNEDSKKKIDNRTTSIFETYIGDKNNMNKSKEEAKPEKSIFVTPNNSSHTTPNFSNPPSIFGPGANSQKSENKNDVEKSTNERTNEIKSGNQLFININSFGLPNQSNLFSAISNGENNDSKSLFFNNNNDNNNFFNKMSQNKKEEGINKKEEGGLFSQQTQVSSQINDTELFRSNKADNKDQNKSLFGPPPSSNTISLFGNNKAENKEEKKSLFGFNAPVIQGSLFSNNNTENKGQNEGKSLFNDKNPFIQANNNVGNNNKFNLFGNNQQNNEQSKQKPFFGFGN